MESLESSTFGRHGSVPKVLRRTRIEYGDKKEIKHQYLNRCTSKLFIDISGGLISEVYPFFGKTKNGVIVVITCVLSTIQL